MGIEKRRSTLCVLFYIKRQKLLTSSTCHPKLIGEQWSDSLVPFHNHCFAYNILVER